MKTEHLILSALVKNEAYMRETVPHLKEEYFSDGADLTVFSIITEFINKYNQAPTISALTVELNQRTDLSEAAHANADRVINTIENSEDISQTKWLVDKTETFCQEKAIYNALVKAIAIADGQDSKTPKTAIPSLLTDALSVSFDTKLGHDYLDDAESRYDFYHTTVSRLPFDIEILNKATRGGIPDKTLNIILAGTNVGKSLIMCHLATSYLQAGKNVLYITLEMAEERIAERIDANLLNTDLDFLMQLPKETFMQKINRVKAKTVGKLKIVEYPTASAGAANFRHLLNELRLKSKFVADVIFIDYINLCTSSRIKAGSAANSFTIVKSIAEELRGLAVEFKLPIWSATQTTRSGLSSSDLDLTDVSESIALASTCDFMLGVTQSEEMAELEQYSFKQLKSRYGDKNKFLRFAVGVDKGKMRLFDIDPDEGSMDDKPLMDKTSFGSSDFERGRGKPKHFTGFK